MPKNILVVDDDEMMRSFFADILKEEGYAVETAGHGKEGFEALNRSDFDLVLTDLRMPDISGLELMREGRTLRPGARWVIVTAYGLTESTGVVSICRPDDDPETIATTSGVAIPDTEVRVVDGEGVELPCNAPGEIVCRGYNVMLGYLDNPEATAETIDDA
jgi:CheY-like chemotaxis protein